MMAVERPLALATRETVYSISFVFIPNCICFSVLIIHQALLLGLPFPCLIYKRGLRMTVSVYSKSQIKEGPDNQFKFPYLSHTKCLLL